MSDLEWDAEDFVPPPPATTVTDKWDGEDEDFNSLKESWEDDDDNDGDGEKKKDDQSTLDTKKKKRKLQDILAEKEKKRQEELERRRKEKEEERSKQTAESLLEEKLRIQKIQEDSDLALASDMLGIENAKEVTPLDGYSLDSKDELEEFRKALLEKIRNTDRLEKRTFYVPFVEDLSRELCVNMEMEDVKRVTSVLNALYNEKVKANKPTKGKKKNASKAKLNPGQGAIADNINNEFDYGEFDDFM